jgi:hypothetical protein
MAELLNLIYFEEINMSETKKLFRFFIPFVNSHNQIIPEEKRADFIRVLEEQSCQINGGFTSYDANGGYRNEKGEIVREPITVFETYGENPLPPERMIHCCKYLAQESLIVMIGDKIDFIDYKENVDITKYKLPE